MSEHGCRTLADRTRGFTLVELMIAMLLGLVVIGGALGVILANRQSYRTNEGLSQVQESARTAFELLARDVRQAGVTGCNNDGRVANVVVSESGTPWWQTWFGIRGFDDTQSDGAVNFGTAPTNRVLGTDSLHLQGIEGTGLSVDEHQPASANIKISTNTTLIAADDIIMVCDFDHAAILKVTEYNSANVTLVHNTQQSESPRNCSVGLGYPTQCGPGPGNSYRFGRNSQIAKLAAVDWYIGNNGRAAEGGRSLYRLKMRSLPEEIVAGVTDMQVTYRESGRSDFRSATATGPAIVWTNVNAVMITLTMQSTDRRVTTETNVNSGRLERRFSHVVTLRNRVP